MEDEKQLKKTATEQKMSKKSLIIAVIIVVLILLAVVIGPRLFGHRLNITYVYQDIVTYENEDPKFLFKYDAAEFEIDSDEEGRYGEDYLIGIKVKNDVRTGCDVRLVGDSLDIERPIEEISAELSEQLASGSTDFQTVNSDFTDFGGKRGVDMSIKFLGPLGDKSEIRQVFIPEGEQTYSIICGGSESLKKYYQGQYDQFFKTFSFD